MDKIFGVVYILMAVIIHFATVPTVPYPIWLIPQIILVVVGILKILNIKFK